MTQREIQLNKALVRIASNQGKIQRAGAALNLYCAADAGRRYFHARNVSDFELHYVQAARTRPRCQHGDRSGVPAGPGWFDLGLYVLPDVLGGGIPSRGCRRFGQVVECFSEKLIERLEFFRISHWLVFRLFGKVYVINDLSNIFFRNSRALNNWLLLVPMEIPSCSAISSWLNPSIA